MNDSSKVFPNIVNILIHKWWACDEGLHRACAKHVKRAHQEDERKVHGRTPTCIAHALCSPSSHAHQRMHQATEDVRKIFRREVMLNKNGGEYIPVDIEKLRDTRRDISFDVYLKISDSKFAHVFSRATGIDYKRLAQYHLKGIREFYIKAEDQAAFEAYISESAQDVFENPDVPEEEKIAVLLNMTEQNMTELFTKFHVDEDTAKRTKKVIENYVTLMTSEPQSLSMLLKLVCHGEYLYYHAIAVSVFSMFIAKATGHFDQANLEIIGMGGFLHDIGMTKIPIDLMDAPRELSPQEWDVMKTHPQIGLDMLKNNAKIPDEVRFIVYQHHEEPRGLGYPNGLHDAAIFYPAKIVALADAFSSLISRRPYRPAYSVADAIQILDAEKGKHDPNLIKIMKFVFGRDRKAAA